MTGEQLETMFVVAAGAAYAILLLVAPATFKVAHWSRRKRLTIAVLALAACAVFAVDSVI